MAKKMLGLEDLTEKQAAFVRRYVETGGARDCKAEAVMAAGYRCKDEASARSIASHLLKDPRVLEVIRGLTEAKFKAGALVASDFLLKVVEGNVDGQVPKVAERIKAAKDLLDRAGLMAINRSEVDVQISDNRGYNELLQSVNARLQDLGLPSLPPPSEGSEAGQEAKAEAIDAEFQEIDPDAPYGRSVDAPNKRRGPGIGQPKGKPGRKPYKRRLIKNPDAVPDYYETRAEKKNREMKEKLVAAAKKRAREKLERKAAREAEKELERANDDNQD